MHALVGSLVVGEEEQAHRDLRDDQRLRQGKCVRDEAPPSELAAPIGDQRQSSAARMHTATTTNAKP